jgi:anti-sigma B factor antagonist
MTLTSTDLPDGIRKIDLIGRLDLEGANAIDLKFTVLTSTDQTLSVVDLSGVDFLASIGISTLVRGAKAAKLRRGNLVLLSPRPNVAAVLASTRIDLMIPVCQTLDQARLVLKERPSSLA